MGRRHPAPAATKAGPGGTSSRYFEVCERDKRTMLPLLDMSEIVVTQKFTSIEIETTNLRSTWWVDDILHLQRRRQDQEVPRVDTSR